MRLIIEDLEGSTTVVNLGKEDVTIGRKPHNTIQLTEQNVSRSHAKLIFQDDGWVIQDLGSYNGVRVNGVPITGPTLLRESDLIQIGDYHLTLTDDVDRETVDIERPRMAANDGAAVSAGASSELPSVSVDDLPPMRPPNFAPGDSASYRQDALGPRDDEKNNQTGLIIGIVGAVLAMIAIAVLIVKSVGEDSSKDPVAAKNDEPRVEQPQDAAGDTAAKAVLPADSGGLEAGPETGPETGPEAGSEAGGLAGADEGEFVETDGGTEPSEEAGALAEDTETEDGIEPTDGDEIVDTDAGSEPEDEPAPKPRRPKPRKQPATPKLPPDQALAEARKASLTGNNRKAYSLAKDAYDQSKSSEALSVMGVAACKMGSESKAKAAYKKMSNTKDKQTLEKVCAPLGIELK